MNPATKDQSLHQEWRMAVPRGENQFIYGLHDAGGEQLLIDNGQAKGWVLVTEAIGANPNDQSGREDLYRRLADQGLGVIVRLNNAYGPSGTIPLPAQYRDFARRAANFVRNSPGAHIWIIGNEMNLEREQPRQPGGNRAAPITPRLYADCYRLCRQAIKGLRGHADDQVVVGAIGPWNAETAYEADPQGVYPANKIAGARNEYPYQGFFGDFIVYLRDILAAIGRENCDAIALHAYSHGYDPLLIFSERKMDPPFANYHFNFRTYQDQMNVIPAAFRDLPVYITEANGDKEPETGVRWPDVNSGWVKNAYKEINDWNQSGRQQIRCLILYRWSRDDDWHIAGKEQVQKDLREAIARNYQWDPEARPPDRSTRADGVMPPPETAVVIAPDAPLYRTQYLDHNTPTSFTPAQTLEVGVVVQNAGSLTWTRADSTPFRLGFQWYTPEGQFLEFPPDLNFYTPLPHDVPPGQAVSLTARLRTPETPGLYQLRWDMLQEGVTWFTSQGDTGLLISPVTVTVPATGEEVAGIETGPLTVQIREASTALPRSQTGQYPRRTLADIHRIILHHTATGPDVSIRRIAEFQVNNRGLPGIAYHYCLTAEGVIYQTQPLEVVTSHGGEQYSANSIGVCLIGNFMEKPPPQPQLNATAALLALLIDDLNLSLDQIVGYSELVVTGSPGATWPQWRQPLLNQVTRILAEAGVVLPSSLTSEPASSSASEPTSPDKPLLHYMLLWYRGPDEWAEQELRGAMDFIRVYAPTIGFFIEPAKLAQYVTIVGGPEGVPATAEQILREAGCQVQRVAGATAAETGRLLQQMAAQARQG